MATVGSGPYPEAVFDDLLGQADVEICGIEEAPHLTDVLVIGRTDWEEEDVDALLDALEGERLKVYSQEMFLLHWMSGRDPFDDPRVARAFGRGHPALEYLATRWLNWPSTFISIKQSGSDDVLLIDAPEVGVLSFMGYRVGKRGLPASKRQAILSTVFNSALRTINSAEYMRSWGAPKSRERLKMMAESIAWWCRGHKRKGNSLAASHYEEDLAWLRRTYHTGRFRFRWPDTRIG